MARIARKGECGGTPRVGKVGDPKPWGRHMPNRPMSGRGMGRGSGRGGRRAR